MGNVADMKSEIKEIRRLCQGGLELIAKISSCQTLKVAFTLSFQHEENKFAHQVFDEMPNRVEIEFQELVGDELDISNENVEIKHEIIMKKLPENLSKMLVGEGVVHTRDTFAGSSDLNVVENSFKSSGSDEPKMVQNGSEVTVLDEVVGDTHDNDNNNNNTNFCMPEKYVTSAALTRVVNGNFKQFCKVGDRDQESGSIWKIRPDDMDQVSVHQRFLHSYATSYKWMIEDNGGGMDPDKMQQCMSLGYSLKNKVVHNFGQYENGVKTSTKSLGADVIGDQWVPFPADIIHEFKNEDSVCHAFIEFEDFGQSASKLWNQYWLKCKQSGPDGKGRFKCGSLDHETDIQFDTFEWKQGWSTTTCRKK